MLYAEEGRPAYAISRVSNEADADILFVGTKARQGIKGIVLGNTSEHIIHSTSLDVITIHEPQGT
jgi:nucleotide-binding universal stress UspA family protein